MVHADRDRVCARKLVLERALGALSRGAGHCNTLSTPDFDSGSDHRGDFGWCVIWDHHQGPVDSGEDGDVPGADCGQDGDTDVRKTQSN